MDDWSLDGDDFSQPVFRAFSREELEAIRNRIFEKRLLAKKRAERKAKNIAVST